MRRPNLGSRTNRLVEQVASRVDDQTGRAATGAARVLRPVVRLLKWPSLVLLAIPTFFVLATLLVALPERLWLAVALAVVAAAVLVAFGVRRAMLLRAVEDETALATELGIAVTLSDKVDETRGHLLEITSRGHGASLFGRARGIWRTLGVGSRWIEGVGDLPRARYFFPPRIGTTVAMAMATLWLVPLSMVLFFFTLIAAVAR